MSHPEGDHENKSPIPSRTPDLSWVAQDPQLRERAVEVAKILEIELLEDLIVKYERFNQPVTVQKNDGSTYESPNFFLEELLKVMPEYLHNAREAGLGAAPAYMLVSKLLTAEGHDNYRTFDRPVVQLSRIFEATADRSQTIDETEYVILEKLIVDTANREDDNSAALEAYRALTRLGFNASESNSLIRNGLFTDALVIDPAVNLFNALSVAPVAHQNLIEICQLIPGKDPQLHDIQSSYAILTELIKFSPKLRMAPNDILTACRNLLTQGYRIDEVAARLTDMPAIESISTAQSLEVPSYTHFIDKPGKLELSPLPYRTERSFSEGAADIGHIALHQLRYREPCDEGFWVFDPNASPPAWYSLGGETQLVPDRLAVRHDYPPYPLGNLSSDPVFHAHPTALEGYVGPKRNNGIIPDIAIPAVTRFVAATPSRRDYAMVAELMRSAEFQGGDVRSFIAHGSGTTEYTFPNDPNALEEMSQTYGTLRDEVMQNVNWQRTLAAKGWRGYIKGERRDTDEVVNELVRRLNKRLPRGFRLNLIAPEITVEL